MVSHSSGTLKPLKLSQVQRRRKWMLRGLGFLGLCALPFFASTWTLGGKEHEAIEMVGLVAIGLAILGRAWCTLYIGGRKTAELVMVGPYSLSRNPLYVFSFIGVLGAGWQSGSLLVGCIAAILAWAVFMWVIPKEEAKLFENFGEAFSFYKAHTPRFWPRFSRWKDVDVLMISPKLLWRTIRDGLVFLCVLPVLEGIEYLQMHGIVHPLVFLP